MAVFHVVSLMAITLIGSSLARLEQVCTWSGLRAAIVRDALYVNGGSMVTIEEVAGLIPLRKRIRSKSVEIVQYVEQRLLSIIHHALWV